MNFKKTRLWIIKTLKDPDLAVAVSELGDNTVNLAVSPDVNLAGYSGVCFGALKILSCQCQGPPEDRFDNDILLFRQLLQL